MSEFFSGQNPLVNRTVLTTYMFEEVLSKIVMNVRQKYVDFELSEHQKHQLFTDLKTKMMLEFGNIDFIVSEFVRDKSSVFLNAIKFKDYIKTVDKVKGVSGNKFLTRDKDKISDDVVSEPPKNHFYKDFMNTQL